MPTTFISYRHEDDDHVRDVRAFAHELQAAGVDVALDAFELDRHPGGPPEGWPAWCEAQAQRAERVLVVASPGWLRAWEGTLPSGSGLGCVWEAAVLRNRRYAEGPDNAFLRFVHLPDRKGPVPLSARHHHQFDLAAARDGLLAWLTTPPSPPPVRPCWPADPPTLPWQHVVGHETIRDAVAELIRAGSDHRVLRVIGDSALGKSTILRNLERGLASVTGLRVARMDLWEPGRDADVVGRATEALGLQPRLGDASARLSALARAIREDGSPTVLLVDTWERAAADTQRWFEDGLADAWSDALRVVIMGQRVPAYNLGPVHRLALPPLAAWERFAEQHNLFLQARPVDPDRRMFFEKLRTFHELAVGNLGEAVAAVQVLSLFTMARSGTHQVRVAVEAARRVEVWTDSRVDQDGPPQRLLLEAACVAMSVDAATLALLVGIADGRTVLQRLSTLAGVSTLDDGRLVPHEAVRRTQRALVRAEDPSRWMRWCQQLAARAMQADPPAYADAAFHALAGGGAASTLWAAQRQMVAAGDVAGQERLEGLCEDLLGEVTGEAAAAVRVYRATRRADRGALEDAASFELGGHPGETGVRASLLLATLRLARGGTEGALGAVEAARALHPNVGLALHQHHELALEVEALQGDVLQARGDLDGALQAYEAFRSTCRALVARDPTRWDWQRELAVAEAKVGDVLQARGDLDGALRAYEACRSICRALVAHDPARWDWQRDLAVAESRVGDVLQARGDLDGALRAYEADRLTCRALVAHDPARWDWQRDLAFAESRVGGVLQARGDLAGALRAYEACRSTCRTLVAHDPARLDWQRDLAVAESRVGDVLEARGDLDGALRAYEAFRSACRALVAHDPARWDWQYGLACAEVRVGDVLQARGDLDGALQAYEACRSTCRALVAHDPARWDWQRDLGIAEVRIGDVLQARGDLGGALQAYEAFRSICRALVAHDPARPQWQQDLAIAERRCASVPRADG